jgi:hypothetical protein
MQLVRHDAVLPGRGVTPVILDVLVDVLRRMIESLFDVAAITNLLEGFLELGGDNRIRWRPRTRNRNTLHQLLGEQM